MEHGHIEGTILVARHEPNGSPSDRFAGTTLAPSHLDDPADGIDVQVGWDGTIEYAVTGKGEGRRWWFAGVGEVRP